MDIGTFSNPSLAAEYSDFTSMVVNMNAGQSYSTVLSLGHFFLVQPRYWKVWIDYNQDGDFTDSGEEVFSASGESDVSGVIAIPAGATPGHTRMRVSMSFMDEPPPCGPFGVTEVEDYTVNIVN